MIVPTFNRPDLFLQAVESVLAHTFHDFEGIGDARTRATGIVLVKLDGSVTPFGGATVGGPRSTLNKHAPPVVGQVAWRRTDLVPWDQPRRTGRVVEWLTRMTHAAVFVWEPRVGYFWRVHDGARHARHRMVPARRSCSGNAIVQQSQATCRLRQRPTHR